MNGKVGRHGAEWFGGRVTIGRAELGKKVCKLSGHSEVFRPSSRVRNGGIGQRAWPAGWFHSDGKDDLRFGGAREAVHAAVVNDPGMDTEGSAAACRARARGWKFEREREKRRGHAKKIWIGMLCVCYSRGIAPWHC